MNNNIQCSIESSTTKIELNSAVDGVFLVPELEGLVGLPEIRTTSGVNAGYDGGWTSAQHYDARLISIRGVIANPDISKVEDKRRAIASLLGQGRKEQLTLRFTTEAGNAYAISVRTISCEMALQRVLTTQEFLIQLRADDPLIYDDGTTGGIAAILQPQRALGGFEINFELPLAIGGGAEDTVVDNGNETVYPVIKLYGALHSPTVVNRTTNQQMQILADLQYSIDWHTYRSATGDYILVNDGLDGAPMTLSQFFGNAEQTTYSGKNLLPSINTTRTRNGVTFTHNEDGSISLSGTASADTAYPINVNSTGNSRNVPLSAGNYIVSGGSATSPTTVYMQAYYGTTGGADRYSTSTFTLEADGTMGAYIYVKSGANTAGKTIYPMVEQGSTATDYEPYVGGTPAPNPSYPQDVNVVTGAQNIEVVGKNLLDTSDPHDKSGSGMTATWNNGTVEVKGTNTTTSFPLSDNIALPTQIKAGTEISASFVGASVGNTIFRFFNQATSQYEALAVVNPNTSGTYTLTRDADAVQLYKGSVQTNTYKEFSISNWQIEYGSTATTYIPYQGQRSYEVNLGKNLLDNKATTRTYLGVTLTKNNDGSITLNGTSTGNAQFYLDVDGVGFQGRNSHLGAGTYTINGRDSGGVKFEINYQTANGSSKYSWGTFTVAEPFDYGVYVNITNGTTVNNLRIYPQLERGSQATTYAPYFPPIELAKVGNYQDRIYKSEGKWYIEKQVGKVVFDGSEAWSGTNSNAYYYRTLSDAIILPSSATMPPVTSDYYTPATRDDLWASQVDYGVGLYNGAIARVSIRNKDCANSDALKTWLSTHPTTVYYALATPTTTEITDETLLLQLNFLASLYEGENNISLVGTGAQGEMTIRYATDYTVNQGVITIDSQARTITLNGQDVYHLKTSESEFLALAPGENKLYLTSEVSDDSGYAEVKFKQGYLSI